MQEKKRRVNRRNEGITEADILQNQFTAYLKTALHNCKIEHLTKKNKVLSHEIGFPEDSKSLEDDFVIAILENDALQFAFWRIQERDRLVVALRIVEEKSFQEIAVRLGMKYSSVTMVYYRALDKLRIILCEDECRF